MRRAGWFVTIQCLNAFCLGVQHLAAGYHVALGTGPRAYAAAQRAAVKVSIAFLKANLFYTAFYTHRAFQLYPVKLQRSKRVARQFLAFVRLVIGVPNHTACVKTLNQHNARRRPQVAAHGGQSHGVGFRNFGVQSSLQPLLKLLKRVAGRARFDQFGQVVTFAQICDGGLDTCHVLIVYQIERILEA